MLEYVRAGQPFELWTAQDIRDDSPEDAGRIADADVGVLLHSGDEDGALLIGTPDEIINRLSAVIEALEAQRSVSRKNEACPRQRPGCWPCGRIECQVGDG